MSHAMSHLWHKGRFLHERAASPRGGEAGGDPGALRRAEERMAAWAAGMGRDESLFAERISRAGLDRRRLRGVLMSVDAPLDTCSRRPSWVDLLEQVAAGIHDAEPLPELPQTSSAPFPGFTRPFLQIAAARLRAGITEIERRRRCPPAATESAVADLLAATSRALLAQATRTLVLELNVARMTGRLGGETPEDRLRYFSTTYFEDRARLVALLEEYPVLGRLLAVTVERSVDAALELLDRFAADRAEIARALGGGEPAPLASVRLGLSDPHRGARSVAILGLSSGLEVVYKPRPVDVEERFQEILRWLEARGLRHANRTVRMVPREGYGWVELITAAPCQDREAVGRFYYREGCQLALLYLLRAMDFHHENIIACGEHPVLIDLESLFYHRVPTDLPDDASWRAYDHLNESVLRVGILPMQLRGKDGEAVDVSGIGGKGGQLSPRPLAALEGVGQDTMRVVQRRLTMDGAQNRPQLPDGAIDPAAYLEHLAAGFRETYELIARHRDELLQMLPAFAGLDVRHILRGTDRYQFLLQESRHPDFLREGLSRDEVMDRLWIEVKGRSAMRRVVLAEHADLLLGDIPYFTARPGERHIYTSSGECVADFFEEPSLAAVKRRIRAMSEGDLEQQLRLLRTSMTLLAEDADAFVPYASRLPPAAPSPISRQECLDQAIAIGDHLAAQAIRGASDACWIGVRVDGYERGGFALSPLRTGLYDGMAGMALFFGHLAAASGEERFLALTRRCVEPVLRAIRAPGAPEARGIGPFSGLTGHVYALAHVAAICGDQAILEEALAQVPAIETQVEADHKLDLVRGAAGCALVMLGLRRMTRDPRALSAAVRCGEHLLARSQPCEAGLGWKVGVLDRVLTGLSHGAAGFAWALLELGEATGDARYRDAALGALAFERSQLVRGQGNWRDLRPSFDHAVREPSYHAMWCNGAAGIALGRLLSLRHIDDPLAREEIEMGLRTTLARGFGYTHSLCHGDMGNIEILSVAARALGEPRWEHEALVRAARVRRQGIEERWFCAAPAHQETPGLMVGLAGIGMGFLRLWSPERVPSVLCLDAPAGGLWRGRAE